MNECNCMIPYLEGVGQHSPGCAIFKCHHGVDLDEFCRACHRESEARVASKAANSQASADE